MRKSNYRIKRVGLKILKPKSKMCKTIGTIFDIYHPNLVKYGEGEGRIREVRERYRGRGREGKVRPSTGLPPSLRPTPKFISPDSFFAQGCK